MVDSSSNGIYGNEKSADTGYNMHEDLEVIMLSEKSQIKKLSLENSN